MYYLTLSTSNNASRQLSCPFTTSFTADGYFVAKPFQQWLASSIDVIGEADVKNAATGDEQSMVDSEVNGTTTATGAEGKGKGTKRSKRKG